MENNSSTHLPLTNGQQVQGVSPCLHILAQFTQHAEALITGDRAGLLALQEAVTKALAEGRAESTPVFVNDGEGYTVIVERVEATDKLPEPYASLYISKEITYWRERALDAEGQVFRLKYGQRPEQAKE